MSKAKLLSGGAIDQRRRAIPANPGDERKPELTDETRPDVIGHAERHSAKTWHMISAEGLVKHREHRCEIAPGAGDIARVMPAMHHRRHEEPADAAVHPRK